MLKTHGLQWFSSLITQNKFENRCKNKSTFRWCILAFYPTYFDAPELIFCMQGSFYIPYRFLISERSNSIILIWFWLLVETIFHYFFYNLFHCISNFIHVPFISFPYLNNFKHCSAAVPGPKGDQKDA